MRKFLFGFLTAILMLSTINVFASNKSLIEVIFNANKVIVDGEQLDGDTINYNDTTYVPLRMVSEIFNKEINYDAEEKTIYLGKMPIKPIVASELSTLNTPVPMGMTHTVEVDNWGYKYSVDVQIKEVMYKDQAYDILKEVNMFNDPDVGYEFILAKVSLSNFQSKEPVDFNKFSFTVIDNNKATYQSIKSIIEPQPALETTLYPGGEYEGWVAYQVKANDIPALKWSDSEDYFSLK